MSTTAPESAAESAPAPYRVLARRYRPRRFEDLIGQEAMVRTLANAFAMNRIAHAFMLTGVRGVGKTTTARLLARALNYESDACAVPSMTWEAEGRHCAAIMAGRHMDVMEMDAASHTGIADVREIIEQLQYAATSARYKVYIIDEVHMLSTAAFNGLLKTLEEPPAHVKFIFATTEIRKVPVTILSRCQRFDLRRLDGEDMARLLRSVAEREEVTLEDGALALLARAADGSARDALSLLDQAIAMRGGDGGKAGSIDEAVARDMLSLADSMRICDLFDAVMEGKAASALEIARSLYDVGTEPALILADLAEVTHWLTRLRLAPDSAATRASMPFGSEGQTWGKARAEKLAPRELNRVWQMLLKGLGETRFASKPVAAMEMLLVRLCHAADMPPLDEALRQLASGGGMAGEKGERGAASPQNTQPSPAAGADESGGDEGERLKAEAVKMFPGAVLEEGDGNKAGEGR